LIWGGIAGGSTDLRDDELLVADHLGHTKLHDSPTHESCTFNADGYRQAVELLDEEEAGLVD
jgi:hypothetical protein